MNSPNEYETRLADWKAKHGWTPAMVPGSIEEAEAEDAARRVADKKLKGEDYCVVCGHGPQLISGMELITRRDDPYIQFNPDDEDDDDSLPEVETRVRACPKCWAVEYGDEDELSDDAAEPSNISG